MYTFQLFFFRELPPGLLYNILKLRQDVFIIEQNCIYEDIDQKDELSQHLCLLYKETLIAYARLVPPTPTHSLPSIGRIVVAPEFRKQQFGKKIILKALDIFQKSGEHRVYIEAQYHLIKYYRIFGFEEKGEPYDLDGITHIHMEIDMSI